MIGIIPGKKDMGRDEKMLGLLSVSTGNSPGFRLRRDLRVPADSSPTILPRMINREPLPPMTVNSIRDIARKLKGDVR